MATVADTVEFILTALGNNARFTTRRMFGEYALYADGRVVALICNDQLYVKILPESHELATYCEQDTPYEGARLHYVVAEEELGRIAGLDDILFALAVAVPPPKKKNARGN